MRKTRKKLLLIMSFPPPYHGSNIANETLWKSKIQEEFHCVLLDTSDKRDINNLGKLDFINVKLALKALWDLIWILKKEMPDVAYLGISQSNLAYLRDGLFIILVKLFSNSKIVIQLHGSYFREMYNSTNWFMRQFIKRTVKNVDAAIVYSKALRYIFGGWVKDIYEVPNGTDIISVTDVKQKFKANKKRGVITVLYLSNLLESKGIVDVVKSMVMVAPECPNVVCKIAGLWANDPFTGSSEIEIKKKIMNIVSSNGLGKKIEFLGVVSGVAKKELLLKSDIFVLPTYYPVEGHPVSIIEAMAAGCLVISTRKAAIIDTVVNGETGYFVEPRNPTMLANRIIRLAKDRELREKMSRLSRKRYEELYTKECFIENMIGVFNRALGM